MNPHFDEPLVTERSKYQQNIIKNYYENRENIALQRVQELVTELYLSEGKKRETQWDRLEKHLLKLDVKQPTIDSLRKKDDPLLVAKLAERLGKELDSE
jgi:hypothetical protein